MSDIRQATSPLVTLTVMLSLAVVGVPQMTRAADVPAPTLVLEPAQAQASTPRVAVAVDTEDLGEAGEALKAKIDEVTAGVLETEGFVGARDDRDPRVVVVVERAGTEEKPGFVVGFSVESGEEIVPGSSRQADCSLCTRTELVERIEQELPGLLELARGVQVVDPVESGDEGGGDDGGEGGGDDGGEDGGEPGGKKIGALGFAGIGVGVVGLVGVGVGVAYAVRGVEPKDEFETYLTDYRTPGNIVLSIGGAMLIAGVVMIAVDVSKRKKASAKTQKARIEAHGAGFAF